MQNHAFRTNKLALADGMTHYSFTPSFNHSVSQSISCVASNLVVNRRETHRLHCSKLFLVLVVFGLLPIAAATVWAASMLPRCFDLSRVARRWPFEQRVGLFARLL